MAQDVRLRGEAGGLPVETCHTLRLQSRELDTTIAESGENDRPVMSSPCPCTCNFASELKYHHGHSCNASATIQHSPLSNDLAYSQSINQSALQAQAHAR